MKKYNILFVEDQEDLGGMVKKYLESFHFEIDWCMNASTAYTALNSSPEKYNLLVVDIGLPDIDGFQLVEQLKNINNSIPFLFLTSMNKRSDRIRGLKLGADDYINKPFDIEELLLRITNIIHRKKGLPVDKRGESDILNGDIVFQKNLLQLLLPGNKAVSLTVRESQLLEYLFSNVNQVVKKESILIQLWGKNDYFLGKSLDTFISRLRKLLSSSEMVSIDNVYGVGFIFRIKESA